MIRFLVFCSFCVTSISYATGQQYLRLQDLGSDVQIHEINEASDGSIIIGGEFQQINFFDSLYIADFGGQDVFIASYSMDGEEEWIKIIKGVADFEFFEEATVQLRAMESDATGNIYLLGQSNGMPISFDGITYLDSDRFDQDGGGFIFKLDQNGDLVRFVDDFSNENLESDLSGRLNLSDIAVSPSGDLYVAASLDGDLTYSGTTYFSTRNSLNRKVGDPLIIKYDPNGSVLWVEQGKSQWSESYFDDDKTLEIALDKDGDIFLAGTFITVTSSDLGLQFDGLSRLPSGQSGDGVFLVKISSSGVPLWSHVFADDNELTTLDESEQLKSLTTDQSGVLVSINFSDEIIMDGDTILNPSINRGGFPWDGNVIVKLNGDGNLIWHKVFIGTYAEAQIAIDPLTNSTTILASYEDVTFPEENLALSDNRTDFFLADLDSTGRLLNLDTTEYSPNNRYVQSDKHPIRYLRDGSMIAGLQFDGGGTMQIGNQSISNPYSILLRRNAETPFEVNLGSDMGQCGGTIVLDAGVEGISYLWNTGETTQTIEVSNSGLYSVEVTNGEGETASDTIEITIDEPYAFSFPDSVSGFNRVELLGPFGNITYQWSTGETTQNIIVTASGEYGLTVFTPFGCESTSSTVVTIESLDIFKGGEGDGYGLAVLQNEGTFYVGGSGDGFSTSSLNNNNSFFTGNRGDGYSEATLINNQSFFKGNIGDGYASNVLENLSSFFHGSSGDGYGNNSFIQSVSFFAGGRGDGYASAEMVMKILGLIDEALIGDVIIAYPNPTHGPVTIELPTSKAYSSLSIWDIKGIQVLKRQINIEDFKIDLDVSGFTKGTYLMIWKDETGWRRFGRLVKK